MYLNMIRGRQLHRHTTDDVQCNVYRLNIHRKQYRTHNSDLSVNMVWTYYGSIHFKYIWKILILMLLFLKIVISCMNDYFKTTKLTFVYFATKEWNDYVFLKYVFYIFMVYKCHVSFIWNTTNNAFCTFPIMTYCIFQL